MKRAEAMLKRGLEAVVARLKGEWDHPALTGILLTTNATDDVLTLATAALLTAEVINKDQPEGE